VNVPNFISILRMIAAPIAVWLILDDAILTAFWVFAVAGASDALDGFIAKKFNQETEFGKFIDPIADKALLVSVYISLGNEGYLATWLVILVVFRDVLIIGGALLFQTLTQSLTMHPLAISKINTAAQIVLAAMTLGFNGYGINVDWLEDATIIAVAATTVISGWAYVVTWTRRAAEMEDNPPEKG
jgi:cardiolipin synthase